MTLVLATLKRCRPASFNDDLYHVDPDTLSDNWRLDDYLFCPGMRLESQVFSDMDFGSADLEDCGFAGARFENSDLSYTSFRSCDLTGVTFSRCVLTGVSFVGCCLIGAVFDKCLFVDVTLDDCFLYPPKSPSWVNPVDARVVITSSLFSDCPNPFVSYLGVHGNVVAPLLASNVYKYTRVEEAAGLYSVLTKCTSSLASLARAAEKKAAPAGQESFPATILEKGQIGPKINYTPPPPPDKKAVLVCSAGW